VHYLTLSQGEETAQLLVVAEDILAGPSSGTLFHVAQQKAKEIRSGVMVIVAPDGGPVV